MMKMKFISMLFICFVVSASLLQADIARDANGKPLHNQIQRTPTLYDFSRNSVSNLHFYQTNYGIFGYDVQRLGQGGGVWPRGSQNQYLFGGGIWFAAQKLRPDTNTYRNYCAISYNPNSGLSWMVPGRITDGDLIDANLVEKYRVYFSTEFNTADGTPINPNNSVNWPIWQASLNPEDTLRKNRYFGNYIDNEGFRNTNTYPKGPAFISGEDIFTSFKDTDLSRYEMGQAQARALGYPLRLQFENMIYSWGYGDYKDFIFLLYNITNNSSDNLMNCYMAPVMDVDIALLTNSQAGAENDRVKFYETDTTLNLAIQWTDDNHGERGQGFGYLGFSFLESPAVQRFFEKDTIFDNEGNIVDIREYEVIREETGFVRKDSAFYHTSNQLGLVTFRNWPIQEDPKTDDERYTYLASGIRDGDTGPGDKRFMMSTGPFHMKPMDTVRVVVGMMITNTSKGGDADGSEEDLQELVKLAKFAQFVYDDGFTAPQAPDRARFIRKEGLNNAITLTWDATSELSADMNERGMDFLGYRLYRARRTNLDTFSVDPVTPGGAYSMGKGPFGWKQIAQWEIPTPFLKSVHRAGLDNNPASPFIDSLRIVGPYVDASNRILDSMAIQVIRVPRGALLMPLAPLVNAYNTSPQFRADHPYPYAPVIIDFDTSVLARPWGPFFEQFANFTKSVRAEYFGTPMDIPYINFKPGQLMLPYNPNPSTSGVLEDAVAGVVYIDRALMKFNPLYYRKITVNIDSVRYAGLPDDGLVYKSIAGNITQTVDTAYVKNTFKVTRINNQRTHIIDAYVPLATNEVMWDQEQIAATLQYIYSLIKQNMATIAFSDLEQSEFARKNAIVPYMTEITNNRTFTDIGDDNRDGIINYDENPTKTEKLLNNVEYYYKILSYDEGDYLQPTPRKLNDGTMGLPNVAEVYPTAARPGRNSMFEIISIDDNKIGGLYNFEFFAIDPERVQQLFGGDTLELEFQPYWQQSSITLWGRQAARNFGLYRRNLVLRNLTKDQELFNAFTLFEVQPCYTESFRGLFTEQAFSYVLSDSLIVDEISGETISFGIGDSYEIRERSGKFYTGDFKDRGFCYTPAMRPPAYGTLGFSFDFTIQQFGGNFRADIASLDGIRQFGATARTPVKWLGGLDGGGGDGKAVLTTQATEIQFFKQDLDDTRAITRHGSFNNGPGHYLVEFLPGGFEEMRVEWGRIGQKVNKVFRVPYLNLRIVNQIGYDRPAPELGPNATKRVSYPGEIPFMFIDTVPIYNMGSKYVPIRATEEGRYYPDPRNLPYHGISTDEFIGKYNIAGFGFVNGRRATNVSAPNQYARPFNSKLKDYTGSMVNLGQGKYYLTGISLDGQDTLDFVNMLNISGVQFVFDYVNLGRRSPTNPEWERIPISEYVYGEDFKSGDKIMLKTFGGALGLPMPGAKVKVRVTPPMEAREKYSDKLLDQIQVVPNPYYVSHQGQKSPYDARLYFTKLPAKCKIDIYTITGDLVVSIDHDEFSSYGTDRVAVNVWDLLTKNGQRIASQSLAAVISTPDGAQTIKNFTVVVGGFRLIPE